MSKINRPDCEIHKASSKEILYSLESEYQWLNLLKSEDKPYSSLIDIIQREAQKDENDTPPNPSIKAIAEEINEPSAKVTKWLNQLYSSLWDLNSETPELFRSPGYRYELYFKNTLTGQSASFTLWLEQILSYQDRFEWPFINGRLGIYYYYV